VERRVFAAAGWLSDVTAMAGLAGALLTLAILHLFTIRRIGRRTRADERGLERLRDEVWELRAAAEARDRAEAASEAKSRFLATVSHEVRTPLNGILGMADLLTATAIDDEQKSYVEAIRASGQSLGSLIEDLLDLSRIESGKLDVVSEPFAIASLVEGVIDPPAPRAHAKGLEITSFIAPDVPAEMMGDAARLRQVLLNVAGNPVKLTERGGVGLRVAREGRALAISVADTGPGRAVRSARSFTISSRATIRSRASMAAAPSGSPFRGASSSAWAGRFVWRSRQHVAISLPLAGDAAPAAGCASKTRRRDDEDGFAGHARLLLASGLRRRCCLCPE
jgi:phospho-acceptor domain-containing protein